MFKEMEKGQIYIIKNINHETIDTIALKYLGNEEFDVAVFPTYAIKIDYANNFEFIISGKKEGFSKSKIEIKSIPNSKGTVDNHIIISDPETNEKLYNILYKSENEHDIEKISHGNWSNVLKKIDIEYGKEKSEFFKKYSDKLSNKKFISMIEKQSKNLIYSEYKRHKSWIDYRSPALGSNAVVEPYGNSSTETGKNWYGLETLIEIFIDCTNHYEYTEGKIILEGIKKEYMDLLESSDLIEKIEELLEKTLQLSQKLLNTFNLFDNYLKETGKTNDKYNIELKNISNRYYEDETWYMEDINNPIEQIRNGIIKYNESINNVNNEYIMSIKSEETQNNNADAIVEIKKISPSEQLLQNWINGNSNKNILKALIIAIKKQVKKNTDYKNKNFEYNDKINEFDEFDFIKEDRKRSK